MERWENSAEGAVMDGKIHRLNGANMDIDLATPAG
jgi:hypothetical protein